MAECEAPSFSLGFDDDLDTSPNLVVPDSDSDPETLPDPPRRIFKRLRRAPPSSAQPNRPTKSVSFIDIDDDDIEDFSSSSQDQPLQVSARPCVRQHSVCSSSKVSLKGIGVLTPQSCTNSKDKKRKHVSDITRFQLLDSHGDMVGKKDVNGDKKLVPSVLTGHQNTHLSSLEQNCKTQFDNVNQNQEDSWIHLSPVKEFSLPRDIQASAKLETGQSGLVFHNSKLAASPIHRFQLLDSDDDDVLVVENASDANKLGPSSSTGNRNTPLSSLRQDRKTQCVDGNQNQKYLSSEKNFSIPTPAFNEMYEEYFHSAKNTQLPKSNHNEPYCGVNSGCQKDEHVWEAAGPPPPAHHYYFHEDPRVQQLVRSRLCNFSPLGVNTVNQQQNIDYMGQFGNAGSSGRRSKSKNMNVSEGWVDPKNISSSTIKKTRKRNNTKSSVSKGKNNETSKLNSSDVSANWVEPKDAGKRRVQASGQSAGHWYTGSDGRKVYVNKSGKESTGRNAYNLYRKESGSASKKPKKKTRAKK